MSNSVVLERLPAAAGIRVSALNTLYQRKRVYIFITRYGLIYAINLMVMLVGAVNYNNSLAYALTFLLAGLFMVGMLHAYGNLRGLILSASPAEPVFAGQHASFPILFDNRMSKSRLAIALQSQNKTKKFLRTKTTYVTNTCIDIDAFTIYSAKFVLKSHKRGYLVPGRIKISSTWPLGLFRAWSYMEIDQHCVVYPTPMGSLTLPPMSIVEQDEQTGLGSGTEDFIGFRQYQSGDSMRAVDWKAYARERGLISKRFSGKGSQKVTFDWQHSAHIDDTELRLSQMCLWILEAEKQGLQYTIAIPGSTDFPFANGDPHKHLCLEALAKYGLGNN